MNQHPGQFQGDLDRNEVDIDLDRFLAMMNEISELKDKIRELEDVTNVNPWQKVIHLARAVDAWRIFPRIFVVVYIYLMYESVIWFMNLTDPNLEQSALDRDWETFSKHQPPWLDV